MVDDPDEHQATSEPLRQALRDVEDEIRGLPYEVAYIIDPDGTVIAHREGTHNFVGLPAELMRGCVVTHNHPRGTSFSVEDVRTHLATRAIEMRAVSDYYDYSLRVPPGTDWEDVELLVNDVFGRVRRELLVQVRTGQVVEDDASRAIMHLVWSEIAAIRGWDYLRTERQ